MKIETSKSVLKVCGVVAMIYGVLEMLLGVMTTAGGGLISAVGSLAEADVPEVAGPLVLVFGIGIVLMGVFSLVEGIGVAEALHLPKHAHTLGQSLRIMAVAFPKPLHTRSVELPQLEHLLVKILGGDVQFQRQRHHRLRIHWFHALRPLQIQLHEEQPVFILP